MASHVGNVLVSMPFVQVCSMLLPFVQHVALARVEPLSRLYEGPASIKALPLLRLY
jgi:hypothetical protein